jgi:hypothetical protein
MTNLGIIARSDRGGIAAQTYELVQHLNPAKVLVVKPGRERGEMSDMYPGSFSAPDPINSMSARAFLKGLDVVLTVEGWYGEEVPLLCQEMNIRRVVVANPELFNRNTPFDKLVVPTKWMLGSMPENTEELPHPINMKRFTQRVRKSVKTFYHLGSPAMLDRNGSLAVKKALPLLRNECNVIVRDNSVHEAYMTKIGRAMVSVLPGHATPNYWQHWPTEADAFVLPRRYGGLCLPMQEAAAQGMPVITSMVEPQKEWFHEDQLVQPSERFAAGMKGGRVYCYDVSPDALAERMDAFSGGVVDVEAASERSLEWARARSWPRLVDDWRLACGMSVW